MSIAVKVEDVCKNFALGNEEVKVLKNLTFNINKGEFVSLMGPSGSGKSTLLYLIGGLDNPTTGKVMINDKELKLMKDQEESIMRRRDIGFVFQFYNLIPNLNVEENILLPILLDGKNANKYKDELTDILKLVGLEDRRKHTPRELSGGQQQRVAIARALINDPEIILADEPIGNLDSVTGTEIMELFQKINREKKKTIIQVTHNESSASYGNRVINLKDGRIV
jgi:putative ABC transport system ATP-binding protein